MADNHDSSHGSKSGSNGMDYNEHEKTYELFSVLLKWGSIIVVVILLLMLAFCTPK
jgi:hypothetical protein